LVIRKQEAGRTSFLEVGTDCSSQKQRENGFEEREREKVKERESLTFHTKQLFSIRNTERERERERERESLKLN
jgi:hypothetical protein